MRINVFLKKFISTNVAAVLAVALAGCFDLGDFSDEEAYYAAFGDVELVYQNPDALLKDVETEEYSIQDYFYNKNTGEDFTYGDPKDDESDEGKDIPQLSYVYMAIPVQQDMSIESFVLYVNARQTCTLDVSFYVVDELPDGGDFTHVMLLGDPEYQPKLDEDDAPILDGNGDPMYELVLYSDPHESLLVSEGKAHVKSGEWVALMVDAWKSGDTLEIKESQYLLLRFINNSGANKGESPAVEFRVTNLLIRAFS